MCSRLYFAIFHDFLGNPFVRSQREVLIERSQNERNMHNTRSRMFHFSVCGLIVVNLTGLL